MLGATLLHPLRLASLLLTRQDSLWANEHKVTYDDLVEHWDSPSIKLCRPFARVDLETGTFGQDETSNTLSLESETAREGSTARERRGRFSPCRMTFRNAWPAYLDGVRFLRLVCRRGIGFQLTTSGEHWFYNVWTRTVDQRSPGNADFVISLYLTRSSTRRWPTASLRTWE